MIVTATFGFWTPAGDEDDEDKAGSTEGVSNDVETEEDADDVGEETNTSPCSQSKQGKRVAVPKSNGACDEDEDKDDESTEEEDADQVSEEEADDDDASDEAENEAEGAGEPASSEDNVVEVDAKGKKKEVVKRAVNSSKPSGGATRRSARLMAGPR